MDRTSRTPRPRPDGVEKPYGYAELTHGSCTRPRPDGDERPDGYAELTHKSCTRPRPDGDEKPYGYAELTHGTCTRTPIYARLVAEWRAGGRTVPARPDVRWASFADLTADRDP
ncbi:hypothetical protein [Streptomyces sp. NPDC057877]|uniref:hypothetical protein n=1 Tax=Streptomyces sp. NPDC057877 TaxID=3346269 RepID=UPI00367FED95